MHHFMRDARMMRQAERKAGMRFHWLQRVADLRLRQRQFVGCRNRGAMADDGTQDLQLAQVHIITSYCLGRNIIARMIAIGAALARNGPRNGASSERVFPPLEWAIRTYWRQYWSE